MITTNLPLTNETLDIIFGLDEMNDFLSVETETECAMNDISSILSFHLNPNMIG
jgi:hypothetical protein